MTKRQEPIHVKEEVAKKLGIKQVRCVQRLYENDIIALIELNRYRVKNPIEIDNEAKFIEVELVKLTRRPGRWPGKDLISSNLTKLSEAVDVREEVAKTLGRSSGYLSMLRTVTESGDKNLIKKVATGVTSVSQACELVPVW